MATGGVGAEKAAGDGVVAKGAGEAPAKPMLRKNGFVDPEGVGEIAVGGVGADGVAPPGRRNGFVLLGAPLVVAEAAMAGGAIGAAGGATTGAG